MDTTRRADGGNASHPAVQPPSPIGPSRAIRNTRALCNAAGMSAGGEIFRLPTSMLREYRFRMSISINHSSHARKYAQKFKPQRTKSSVSWKSRVSKEPERLRHTTVQGFPLIFNHLEHIRHRNAEERQAERSKCHASPDDGGDSFTPRQALCATSRGGGRSAARKAVYGPLPRASLMRVSSHESVMSPGARLLVEIQ
ncbi:hypothetical protein Cob_v007752 [Colletotrichum orbiculare MAFF 240422]|uniref:Uncharacterized protein n=1 Tax=Colletotrichum orbiculare (strain 104-T / ATCC 96160 / CBS 514.97 / LARS 414 / MAFF 240422) TaxID=1213857 RepID=A0A484FPW0_COLOR|nr:hypothetical protein Cob_v007752 [Colletotrichum orbiculare MAFF 240422]